MDQGKRSSRGDPRTAPDAIATRSDEATHAIETPLSLQTGASQASDDLPGQPEGGEPGHGPGPMSPMAHDRVFPIRSVVSVDPMPTPRAEGGDSYPGMGPLTELPAGVTPQQAGSKRYSMTSTGTQSSRVPETPMAEVAARQTREQNTLQSARDPPRGRQASGPVGVEGTEEIAPWHAQIRGDAGSVRSSSAGRTSSSVRSPGYPASMRSVGDESEGGILTARFKHVITEGGHTVITGRDGDTLQRCEDEPIHIPGAVQGFGLLIAVTELAESKLQIRVVSENSKEIIGYTPKQLFALESFTDILSEEQADNLLDHMEFIKDSDNDAEADGPAVFTISIRHPQTRKSQKLWCAVHRNPTNGDTVICEFELEDDVQNPLVPPNDGILDLPESTLSSNPTQEEYAESTINVSKPLRVLRSARKKKSETAAMEIFNIMSQIENQLAAAPKVEVLLKILIGVVKELTGFHRVMIYQFDHEFNGRVVAELVDPRATKDLYKGLNFPASDIPKQARDMYKINKLRLLYNRDLETARLVCRTMQELESPLDLTHSYLRAMSPIHLKYLANMGVRSSMSISINAFGELWGLVALHAYGNHGMRVAFPIRKMCRLIGDIASRNIERLSYASRLQARKLINTASTEKNPSGYIVASSDDLLKLFDADCGILAIRDEAKFLGRVENSQEALALIEYFRQRKITSILTSQDVHMDFPDLRYPPGFTTIGGLLLVPLTSVGADFIVFFRRPQSREIKWAGNPYEKFVKEGTEGYLEPRKSFKTWSETVVGKCREWNEEQAETAAVLCLVYGKFIEVWRQKEAAVQNTQLTKLLLANSAHEVRTPLNAIINYLEIAMESSLDQETRDNLSRSHSASKSLIYVINDLLDLTKIEEGNKVIKDETFDLPETVQEATDPFTGDAKRKQIRYEVTQNQGVPQQVIGDQRRVRQAISNVVTNAIQHTSQGSVNVELWLASQDGNRVEVDIVVRDTGVGMSPQKLDDLFRELEQAQSESEDNLPELLTPDATATTTKKDEKRTLGYGLALVGRIVRNMNGQLRLKSEEGVGTRFVIQFSFIVPEPAGGTKGIDLQPSSADSRPRSQHSTSPVTEGEVVLVTREPSRQSRSLRDLSRRNSNESMNSGKSGKSLSSFKSGSSTRSDVNRLIDAIQEPLLVERAGSVKSVAETVSPTTQRPARPSIVRSNTAGAAFSSDSRIELYQEKSTGTLPGQVAVTDQKTPVRSIRLPDAGEEAPPPGPLSAGRRPHSQVSFDLRPQKPAPIEPLTVEHMRVLVAEDDLVNCKIMQKRLQKLGHDVLITINGEECASAYGEKGVKYDVVLMDMQMPIVDGLTSTKMIRSLEKTRGRDKLSLLAQLNARVPIFAVSATLIESQRQTYIDAGFDGWILKPVDFKRLTRLFQGIVDQGVRDACVYRPGEWEKGGWFEAGTCGAQQAVTQPSSTAPVSARGGFKSFPHRGEDPFDDRTSREQARLASLKTDAVSDPSKPSNE